MLARNFKTVFWCNKVWWNTSNIDRKFVCINATMNQFKETEDIAAVQAAALDNELCVLVDERDNFIGSATKRECHTVDSDGNVPLHRAFSVLMFNSAGDLLIQKRASQKITFPNFVTNTCCSHPLVVNGVPEEVTSAAIRRLNVELGIPKYQLKSNDFTLLSRFIYKDIGDGDWGEHELDYVLILQSDVKIKPNPDEIAETRYVSRKDFDNFLAILKDPVTPWFQLMYRHMLYQWWDNLHRLKEIAEPQKIHSFVNKEKIIY